MNILIIFIQNWVHLHVFTYMNNFSKNHEAQILGEKTNNLSIILKLKSYHGTLKIYYNMIFPYLLKI